MSVSESLNISIKSVDSWHENRHISKGRKNYTHTILIFLHNMLGMKEREKERESFCVYRLRHKRLSKDKQTEQGEREDRLSKKWKFNFTIW